MPTLNPLDLVRAAPWTQVLFTTYALSLSFFEAVVVDALVRGGGRNPLILSDTEGIRAGLSERGARLVGRDYELLPVQRTGGVFHPKLTGFLHEGDAHLLIGSGNLTFGGWGGNCEVIEHLHPSFAPEAFVDAADFLELLEADERIRLPENAGTMQMADGLRKAAAGRQSSGRIRIIHNAGDTVANRLRQEAEDLGGAESICFASAFYDINGRGVSRLAEVLGCDDVSAYVHPAGSVQGHAGCNWPSLSEDRLKPVTIEGDWHGDKRLLHAKALEIVCRNGRLVLSGSVNGTHAALFGSNMETGVLRIEPNRQGAWSLSGCDAPSSVSLSEDSIQDECLIHVLAAELVGTSIRGTIVSTWQAGPAAMQCEVEGEELYFGLVDVDGDGRFAAPAGSLADRIWTKGRVIVRLSAQGMTAEGFLTVTAIAELARRAGPAAARVLAILTGTETPQDVAAIMAWFHEDPSRMPRVVFAGRGSAQDRPTEPNQTVTADMLANAHFGRAAEHGSNERSAGWQSAMTALLAAFRSNRGPFGSEGQSSDDDDEGGPTAADSKEQTQNQKANEKAVDHFSKLLDAALNDADAHRYAETMLALAHYLVSRIRPSQKQVALWLDKIMRTLPAQIAGEFASDVLTLQILQTASSPSPDMALRARRLLIRKKLLDNLENADLDRLPAFHAYFPQAITLELARAKLAKVRTHREQLRTLLSTPANAPLPSLPLLETSPHWADLKRIQRGEVSRDRMARVAEASKACPGCYMELPTGKLEELRQTGLTRCTSRCGRLLYSVDG